MLLCSAFAQYYVGDLTGNDVTSTVEQLSDHIYSIELKGDRHLAIKLSETTGSRSIKQFVEDGLQPGYLVTGQVVTPWKPTGLTELAGQVYLYGPHHEGRTIETILDQEPRSALKYVIRLASVFAILAERSIESPPFQTNGILFLESGGTLILPPKILERLRNVQIERDRWDTYEIYNHPDFEGDRGIVFSLGVMLYRISTGVFPFSADDEVELHSQMREMQILPPRNRVTTILESLSTGVMESLDPKNEEIGIGDFHTKLVEWDQEGLYAPTSDEEQERLRAQGDRLEARYATAFTRRRFLQKNGRRLGVAGVLATLLIVFASSMIANILKPRVTDGMQPIEVVELFYDSITSLDHTAMEDTVLKGVAKAEVTESTNLFVITRVRLGNEGTTGLVTPTQWTEAERPSLDETISVYGIGELAVEELGSYPAPDPLNDEFPDALRFRASYQKWEQAVTETVAYLIPDANSTVRSRTDEITLEFDGRYWLITDIERIEDEMLYPSDLYPDES